MPRFVAATGISASLVIISCLAGLVVWAASQPEVFALDDGDSPLEILAGSSAKDDPYKPPLKAGPEQTKSYPTTSTSLGVFPDSILEGQWHVGAPWEQFNRETLFEKINGEAQKFIQQGFRSLTYIVLRGPEHKDEIAIELFDQGDLKGSLGIFSEYASRPTMIKQSGEAIYIMTPAGAIGRKGRFFFRLAGNRESETVRKKSVQLVGALSMLPENEAEAPLVFRILTAGMNINLEHITFKRKNVFQFDFARDFWFARPDPDRPLRFFVHQAQSTEKAKQLFNQIVDQQSYDYIMKEHKPDFALMRHSHLRTWFAIKCRGPFIYGIDNETDRKNISSNLNRFAQELPHER